MNENTTTKTTLRSDHELVSLSAFKMRRSSSCSTQIYLFPVIGKNTLIDITVKQLSRGGLKETSSENMQLIYREHPCQKVILIKLYEVYEVMFFDM